MSKEALLVRMAAVWIRWESKNWPAQLKITLKLYPQRRFVWIQTWRLPRNSQCYIASSLNLKGVHVKIWKSQFVRKSYFELQSVQQARASLSILSVKRAGRSDTKRMMSLAEVTNTSGPSPESAPHGSLGENTTGPLDTAPMEILDSFYGKLLRQDLKAAK
jgi:hypothetical protein